MCERILSSTINSLMLLINVTETINFKDVLYVMLKLESL